MNKIKHGQVFYKANQQGIVQMYYVGKCPVMKGYLVFTSKSGENIKVHEERIENYIYENVDDAVNTAIKNIKINHLDIKELNGITVEDLFKTYFEFVKFTEIDSYKIK